MKKMQILPVSVSSVSGPGAAAKTQLGVSVVFPKQVHALHSPPLTLSLPLSLLSLRMKACVRTAMVQANTVR